jgi:hypothetical protein
MAGTEDLPEGVEWQPAFPLPEVEVARGPKGGWYVKWTYPSGEWGAMLPGPARSFAKKLVETAAEAERRRKATQTK